MTFLPKEGVKVDCSQEEKKHLNPNGLVQPPKHTILILSSYLFSIMECAWNSKIARIASTWVTLYTFTSTLQLTKLFAVLRNTIYSATERTTGGKKHCIPSACFSLHVVERVVISSTAQVYISQILKSNWRAQQDINNLFSCTEHLLKCLHIPDWETSFTEVNNLVLGHSSEIPYDFSYCSWSTTKINFHMSAIFDSSFAIAFTLLD